MNNRLNIHFLIVFFSLTSAFSTYGQSNSNLNENYSVSKIEKKIKNINVEILQYKLTTESPSLASCKAKIQILKNNIKIDSVLFSEIGPVGGNYGLMIYNSLINNHLLITKYGDYEGLTIIINDKGQKFVTNGGFVYLDRPSNLLFSISASDLFGFSIFDLNSDSEIFSKDDLLDEPMEFYKSTNGKYFLKAASYNSEKDSFYEINLGNKKITKIDIQFGSTEYQKLEKLIEWEDVKNINCD